VTRQNYQIRFGKGKDFGALLPATFWRQELHYGV